jgi:hypothetical protein
MSDGGDGTIFSPAVVAQTSHLGRQQRWLVDVTEVNSRAARRQVMEISSLPALLLMLIQVQWTLVTQHSNSHMKSTAVAGCGDIFALNPSKQPFSVGAGPTGGRAEVGRDGR